MIKISQSSQQKSKHKTSINRWWRQVTFIPIFHKLRGQWLTTEVKTQLSQKVTQAESGHRGEVVLIVENHLPIKSAYHMNCRQRAIELFSLYRVWDTEENTGVLVYVNICERDLEIVADRGINARVEGDVWKTICDKAIVGLANNKVVDSLGELLLEVGELLRQHYELEGDPTGNELPDALIHL